MYASSCSNLRIHGPANFDFTVQQLPTTQVGGAYFNSAAATVQARCDTSACCRAPSQA